MDNLFYLEIITPEKQFYVGPAEGLVIPAIDGSYGVQPGHEPVVTAIEPGIARFRVNGVWQEVVVSDGLCRNHAGLHDSFGVKRRAPRRDRPCTS